MTLTPSHRNLGLALLVEGGLGLAALSIGWLIGWSPAVGIRFDSAALGEQLRAIGLGVLGTVPLLIALVVLDRVPIRSLERVKDVASQVLGQLFPNPRWWQLALVSAAAGFGEELMFRGLLQAGLAETIGSPAGPWVALGIASLVFGVFHWLNATYALLAALAGLYFGWLLVATGSIWPPIVAHALYDFVALCWLLRPNQMVGLKVEE
jgi:membrane protease YdiL (CAAX protease family)